jgi:hypothetical protein
MDPESSAPTMLTTILFCFFCFFVFCFFLFSPILLLLFMWHSLSFHIWKYTLDPENGTTMEIHVDTNEMNE